MLTPLLVIVAIIVAACFGFVTGILYTARRVPNMLAKLTPDEFRGLARHAGHLRTRGSR